MLSVALVVAPKSVIPVRFNLGPVYETSIPSVEYFPSFGVKVMVTTVSSANFLPARLSLALWSIGLSGSSLSA